MLEWARSRPHWIRETVEDKTLLMFHSTPWEPFGEYVYPHSGELSRFGEVDADFAIYGHTHMKVARTFNGTLVVNPGSTGLGQDPSNDRKLSYAVLDTTSGHVAFEDFDDPSI